MSYYIGFTYNDGGKDMVRMNDADYDAAVAGQPDGRPALDALAACIVRDYGLESASGIRSIDMIRNVPEPYIPTIERKRPQDAITPRGRPDVLLNPLKPHHPLSML